MSTEAEIERHPQFDPSDEIQQLTARIAELNEQRLRDQKRADEADNRSVQAERERDTAQANSLGLQHTFDACHKADMRGIKRWQEATGRTMTWPDRADLVVWLIEQLDTAQAQVAELLAACKSAEEDIRLSRGGGKTQIQLLDAIRQAESDAPATDWQAKAKELADELLKLADAFDSGMTVQFFPGKTLHARELLASYVGSVNPALPPVIIAPSCRGSSR